MSWKTCWADVACHIRGYRLSQETMAQNALEDVSGKIHVMGYLLTQETRVRYALDDVSGDICLVLPPGLLQHAERQGVDGPAGRGLHSFLFQLNLSSSVHRTTQLNS
jgi:hypothetical protein